MFQFIKCPKCGRKIKAILKNNRWIKWIEIYCSDCDYRNIIKEKELDFIQPSSPFFKAIYGNDPIELERRKRRGEEIRNNNLKEKRDTGLELKIKRGLLKPYEVKDIRKYTRENKLE